MKQWTHFVPDTKFVLDEPLQDKRVIVEIGFQENLQDGRTVKCLLHRNRTKEQCIWQYFQIRTEKEE